MPMKPPRISEEQAIAIATERAKNVPFGFKNPYLNSIVRRSDNGHWVAEFYSWKPQPTVSGHRYMYVTVDDTSGEVLAVDSGGSS